MDWIAWTVLGVMAAGFWLWMFWEMSVSDKLPSYTAQPFAWPPATKFTWTLVFVVGNLLGALLYFFTAYRKYR